MKQGLGVFPSRETAELAAAVFNEGYEMTIVGSAAEAIVLAASRRFDLVVLTAAGGCPGATWRSAELIREASGWDLLVAVIAEDPDEAFFAAAQRFGAAVIGVPLGVAEPTDLEPTALS